MILLSIIFVLARPLPTLTDASSIRHALEQRYHQARTLQAVFYEQYSDGHGGGTAESGVVYFSRPDRMRWDYQSPQDKLFLVDGKNAWYYVPSDKVASRAQIRKSTDWRTPIALLAGKVELGKFCKTIDLVNPGAGASVQRLEPQDSVLRCVPRTSSPDSSDAVQEVFFEVQPTGFLARILIHQPGNLEIEFRFGNWQENVPIPEIQFHFSPPPGVSIVDEESLLDSIR